MANRMMATEWEHDRRRLMSTTSYFPSPIVAAEKEQEDGTFLDDMSRRDPSFDLPRLTEDEVAEIIAEGPAIRARMERHKIDVEFVLECNSMLLEWVGMRERLLRQWARVPAELIAPPATTESFDFEPTPRSSVQIMTPRQSQDSGVHPFTRNHSITSLPQMLHRRRSRSLKDRATEAISKNNLVAGFKQRIKPRQKQCGCTCTCGSAPPTTSLKFDDDAVVVIDLHAELIRYDELLRSIKERFDDRLDLPPVDTDDTAAAAAVDREIADQLQAYEDDGRLTRNSSISSRSERSYDDAYEADEESILSCASSVVERRRGESSGPRTSLYGEEWRIAEDDENEIEDESPETRSEYEYEYEGSVVSDAETEHGDAGSVHTMTTRSTHAATASLPPSPITPNSFQDMDVHPFVYSHEHQQDRFHLAPGLMSEHHQHQQLPNPTADGRRHSLNVPGFAAHHNNSISSIDTHRTLGVLSAVMQMEARSILGSECNSSDNYRSYTSYCSDLYATHQTHLHNELSDLLDRSFVFDDQVLDIGVSESKGARAYNRQAQANADDGFPRRGSIMDMTGEPHGELTNEERERVMKPGRALGSHLRNRSVSEFGVRMRSVTAPAISTTPFPTPTNSETPCHQLPQHLPIMHSASAASLRPPQRTRVNARAPPPPEVGKYSDALGGATIYTFSQPTSIREESMTDSFHPMEQFADATSTWDSRRL